MNEVFSGIASAPVWFIILVGAGLYVGIVGGLRLFLRPALAGNLDPLNIRILVFTGPAVVGLLLLPFLTHSASASYSLILLFMASWFVVIRVVGKPATIDLRDRMGGTFQTVLLLLTVLIILAHVTVNMIIPGKIPLLMEGGGLNARFEATENSRLLTWLSFATTPMAGLIYAVTEKSRIRKLAALAVGFQVAENLLFASKSGLLTILFVLLNALFIASLRRDSNRYKSIGRKLVISLVVVALLAPLYLSVIGAGSGLAAGGVLGVRFLGGFDQLIFASQFDLLPHRGFDSVIRPNLFEYQLMPFFKLFLSKQYDYSNIGQYIVELLTGGTVDNLGTYPNSNLILETVFTSGKYLGAFLFLLEVSLFYWCRRIVLSKPITPLSLALVQAVIFDPIGLFASGQDWVTETILLFVVITTAFVLSKVWAATFGNLRNMRVYAPRIS
jgi:hypothetical protein